MRKICRGFRSESNQNQISHKTAEIHQEQTNSEWSRSTPGMWSWAAPPLQERNCRSSVAKKPEPEEKKKMDLFLVLCKEDEHKNRGLTLLHERRELLDGLLGGGRHCRQPKTWGQKPGLFCLFQLPVPLLLPPCVSRFLVLFLCASSPHNQTVWMRGAVVFVGLSSGGLPVIDPSSGVPSLKKDQPRGEGFFCFKQEVRFFL